MRGSRVQAVVGELQGEKVDIIQWSADPATFIVNALAPAEVFKVVLDEETKRIEVMVPDGQLSLAIGRRGQNVRLASQLTGWDIDILTEAEESQRRQEEFRERSEMFVRELDIEEMMAQLLVTEGFTTIEEVAFVAEEELLSIQGFDEETASALQERARLKISERDLRLAAEYKALGVSEQVAELPHITPAMLVALGQANIKTLDDFGDLAADELIDPKDGILRSFELDTAVATEMVMAARAHWFETEGHDSVSPDASS